jgi:hypothetical protein
MCLPSFWMYRLASPKSSRKILWAVLLRPTQKLSGFMSRCRKFRLWMYSMRWIIWSISMSTVFSENLRRVWLKSDSSEGPIRSMTNTL